jgi:hypothetical protein
MAPDPGTALSSHGRGASARALAARRRRAERQRSSGCPPQAAPARSEPVRPGLGSRSLGREPDRRMGRLAWPPVPAGGGPGVSPERDRAAARAGRRGPAAKARSDADRRNRREAEPLRQRVLARVGLPAPRGGLAVREGLASVDTRVVPPLHVGKRNAGCAFEFMTDTAQLEGSGMTRTFVGPGEEWRIKALLLVQDLYDSLVPGWRPDLERVIGLLLGYDRQDIERFVASLSTRSASS